ncbi:malate dehydrogenase [Ascoidea rubescens DSM 1968]|uniref:Malate dehydrogenase n=1 Tax=Ascoidea rubescens DSM 1968 TaxID=1344418 RepID=A0A1D2VA86_9ASCO|nr:malate dehydrogenase [Ascoidea rubescens DSM 1968]ODV58333.1 malate dehydrogenase [Ascoidea rubescens DSM 1968]
MKVSVLGAGGGIGQPLSLLLKLNESVDELSLYDIYGGYGVASDLSHIDRRCKVQGYEKEEEMEECLENSDIVIICAGIGRSSSDISRDELFNKNCLIIRKLVNKIIEFSENSIVLVISNPVNSLVPIVCEMFKKRGIDKRNKIYGITTLDLIRSEVFLREILNGKGIYEYDNAIQESIRVIGGHSKESIVPIILNREIKSKLSAIEYERFVKRVQNGGDEVVEAKNGRGSATLSMAFAGHRFVCCLLARLSGTSGDGAGESAYVGLAQPVPGLLHVEYFSMPLEINARGECVGVDSGLLRTLDATERRLVETAVSRVRQNVAQGQNYVSGTHL